MLAVGFAHDSVKFRLLRSIGSNASRFFWSVSGNACRYSCVVSICRLSHPIYHALEVGSACLEP
jgi:hypothetical protein